ncbi:MAG: Tn3 family transposase [Gammaproteobacteria bacterium]|nr:Tn3 family transposase [Gammaproteobacteria bacterium]
MVQKLSTFSPTNRTQAALREYDRLIKANDILHYIDDQSLRKYVQKTLNRGEAYHQLRRKIASVNGDKFRGDNDFHIEIWNECARLIANCVIFFNASILSGLLEKFKDDEKMRNIITRLSPVAWKIINLNGTYAFSLYETITMEKLLSKFQRETLILYRLRRKVFLLDGQNSHSKTYGQNITTSAALTLIGFHRVCAHFGGMSSEPF